MISDSGLLFLGHPVQKVHQNSVHWLRYKQISQ